ncbi:MAG: helix-turn-helix domain-containing protein [Euzebyales bacterium]|nr:helix-turn-helix domain-containing protein [Euzebyales bacterium]
MQSLDVIADPVRLAIARHLAAHGAASLPELADAAGVHVNTARPHVTAMEEAGLLVGERRPAEGPGRPAVDYRLAQGWTLSATDFLGLAELLATALVRSAPDPAALRGLGREWGGYLVGRPGAKDVTDQLPRVLERLGFQAVVGDEVVLFACPCPLVAPDRPKMVCELAAGVVEGALAAAGSDLRVGTHDHHPEQRRCTVELQRPTGRRPKGKRR